MKLITGRPHTILPAVIDEIGRLSSCGEKCMLLVPSQFTLNAELAVMEQLDSEGSFLIDVLSPNRLRSRIFDQAGAPKEITFDETGKCMVLAGVCEEALDELTVYRRAAQNAASGFAMKLSSLIADFKRSDITPEMLLAKLEGMNPRSTSVRKLRDIARLYAGYEAFMAGKLADSDDIDRMMLEKAERSDVLTDKHLFVYGFDMITPAFARQLIAYDALAKSVSLAVETDANSVPDGRLFAPVNFSLQRLAAQAKENGRELTRVAAPAIMKAHADLAHLESQLFALAPKPFDDVPQHITLRVFSGARAECEALGAAIRRALLSGEDPANIAVIYPKGTPYSAILPGILSRYDVSCYIAEKRSAAGHPLSRFLLSALSCAANGFRPADILECAQSGFLRLTNDEIDRFSGYALSVDLRAAGFKRPLTFPGTLTEEQLAEVEVIRQTIMTPLLAFASNLSAAQNADETISAVLTLLEDVQAYDTLLDMRDMLTENELFSEAEDCAQVWNALMHTLDQLHELLSGSHCSAALVQKLLESGLSSLELSALPPADGAVTCGEIGNLHLESVPTLYAIGMNDMGGGNDEGLLTRTEKQETTEATGAYLGMSADERAALAQLDQLKVLTAASEALHLSFVLSDETGKAQREGIAVQSLRRTFPQLIVSGGIASEEQAALLASPKAAPEALALHLSDVCENRETLSDAYAQTYAAMSKTQEGRAALRSVTRHLGKAPQPRLEKNDARALYGRPIMSVSRLETFADCPYKHFVRYGLSPQQEMQPGVNRAELGTLYHAAAEQFTRMAMKNPAFPNIPDEEANQMMDKAAQPLIDQWCASPLGESKRGGALAGRFRKTARRAAKTILRQYQTGSFVPGAFELTFGKGNISPITVRLADGTTLFLQGRIDRIDVLAEDHSVIRIIDYKSGQKRFDPTMVYYGLQLQLLIYLCAALTQLPGSRASGFFYCPITDPTIKSETRIIEEAEKQIAKKLQLSGIALADAQLLRAQGSQHAAMVTDKGTLNARNAGSYADEETMNAMISYARNKAAELASCAYRGDIGASPAEFEAYNACQHCDYAAVCGFDASVSSRRRLTKKKVEDLK